MLYSIYKNNGRAQAHPKKTEDFSMLTDRIKACTLLEDLMIPDDGYIGIPVRACVLFDKDSFKIKHGHGGTPIVLYVKGTAIERIGTLSDDEILCGMLDRGYVIFVLDYLGDKRAVPPMLDWSVQKIRTDMGTGKYFADIECLGAGRYVESMVVPSGYDVADGVFWSIDKHAADGTLEKIAEIWNNDLCGTNAERVVRWVDGSGVRKPTRMATDGTLPVWLDANGCECERGEYIKLKVAITAEGKIISTLTTYENETDGIGDVCANPEYYEQFNGTDKDSYASVENKTGATVTTSAYKGAIKLAFTTLDLIKGGVQ